MTSITVTGLLVFLPQIHLNIWHKKSNNTALEKPPIMLLPLQLLTDRVKTAVRLISQSTFIALHSAWIKPGSSKIKNLITNMGKQLLFSSVMSSKSFFFFCYNSKFCYNKELKNFVLYLVQVKPLVWSKGEAGNFGFLLKKSIKNWEEWSKRILSECSLKYSMFQPVYKEGTGV